MDRISGMNYVLVDGDRRFQDNSPPFTTIPAEWLNSVQEEIIHVIEAAGLQGDPHDYTQLLAALRAFTPYVQGSGVADAYVVDYDPAVTKLTDGLSVSFRVSQTNTGPSTLNVNGLGAVAIRKYDNVTDLEAGDLRENQIVGVQYDGLVFHLVGAPVNVDTVDGIHAFADGGGSLVSFPSGTKMVFYQGAAPTGWTQVTAHTDKALRVVSGAGGGSGGTHGLSAPPSTAHTHTMPTHSHTGPSHTHISPIHQHDLAVNSTVGSVSFQGGIGRPVNDPSNRFNQLGSGGSNADEIKTQTTSNQGGGTTSPDGTGNTSSVDPGNTNSDGATAFSPEFIDVIVCTKD